MLEEQFTWNNEEEYTVYLNTHSKGHKEEVSAEKTATQVEEQVGVGRARAKERLGHRQLEQEQSTAEQLARERRGTH